MAETILSSPLIAEMVLPFVLVFSVVFAILQKSKILGDGKSKIDSLVALSIALITITFANAVGIISVLLPFLAVSIVMILVFLLMVGMVSYKDGKFELPDGYKKTIMVLAFIAVLVAGLVVTGAWDYLVNELLPTESGNGWVSSLIFIGVIIGAFFIMNSKPKEGGKDKKD
jgi:hypothetical protein